MFIVNVFSTSLHLQYLEVQQTPADTSFCPGDRPRGQVFPLHTCNSQHTVAGQAQMTNLQRNNK